jgi:hypothetical protein
VKKLCDLPTPTDLIPTLILTPLLLLPSFFFFHLLFHHHHLLLHGSQVRLSLLNGGVPKYPRVPSLTLLLCHHLTPSLSCTHMKRSAATISLPAFWLGGGERLPHFVFRDHVRGAREEEDEEEGGEEEGDEVEERDHMPHRDIGRLMLMLLLLRWWKHRGSLEDENWIDSDS